MDRKRYYKEFPVEGIHFLLGNDLAGKQVVPNLIVCKTPQIENEFEEIVPVTVVKREQSKNKEKRENGR